MALECTAAAAALAGGTGVTTTSTSTLAGRRGLASIQPGVGVGARFRPLRNTSTATCTSVYRSSSSHISSSTSSRGGGSTCSRSSIRSNSSSSSRGRQRSGTCRPATCGSRRHPLPVAAAVGGVETVLEGVAGCRWAVSSSHGSAASGSVCRTRRQSQSAKQLTPFAASPPFLTDSSFSGSSGTSVPRKCLFCAQPLGAPSHSAGFVAAAASASSPSPFQGCTPASSSPLTPPLSPSASSSGSKPAFLHAAASPAAFAEATSLQGSRETAGASSSQQGRSAEAVVKLRQKEATVAAGVLIPPRSIHDISNGDHILGFGAQLAEDHPGFQDEQYKQRRSYIADLAKQHQIGTPIPRIAYTEEEMEVWNKVLTQLLMLYPTHACTPFLQALPLFNFSPGEIPQLEDVSTVLQAHTGWRIRPVAGLLHPRDFLNGLAFRYFHSTQYIRHSSRPMYTPEPDICHELLGHAPMLADPDFAELAQAIGLASLGATEAEIWHLTKLYWYTVEFGTILEDGEVKAFGAGLLSSYGELEYMHAGARRAAAAAAATPLPGEEDEQAAAAAAAEVARGGMAVGAVGETALMEALACPGAEPRFVALDPFAKLPKMSYKDGFQKTYFLCSSFADVAHKLRSYADSLRRRRQEEGSVPA